MSAEQPQFLFTCCQLGAEQALKGEIARLHPDFRFAFSRPGFITFKLPEGAELPDDFDLSAVFARAWGFSLGRVAGERAESLAADVWRLAGDRTYRYLHCWERDAALPGEHGYEPGVSVLSDEVGQLIAAADPRPAAPLAELVRTTQADGSATASATAPDQPRRKPLSVNRRAHAGDLVLDCVLVEPNQWWIGCHRATTTSTCFPGGVIPVTMPPDAVSRAYVKMEEALYWSRLPIQAGDHAAEIGSAPGGSCQALLDRGLVVTGIDPSDMAPEVLQRSGFRHVKKRAADIKRREFADVKWLTADSNVAPTYTLDAVEAIVTHQDVHVQGLLLTLKLLDWGLAEHLPEYLARIHAWGFRYVRARQLAHNRQEVCVVALRRRSQRRQALLQKRARRRGSARTRTTISTREEND
jgi:23S rRNA (cytidine2498-2'-O)-methyltransferase